MLIRRSVRGWAKSVIMLRKQRIGFGRGGSRYGGRHCLQSHELLTGKKAADICAWETMMMMMIGGLVGLTKWRGKRRLQKIEKRE